MGEEEGDTVETCSGGLLGKEIFEEKVFLYKIPIIGISGCEFSGFLQVIVNAVNKIVNDCPECDDDSEDGSGSYQALEVKLEALLQGAHI